MSYTGLVQPTAMTSLAEVIDDTTPLINKVYSSDKVQSEIDSKVSLTDESYYQKDNILGTVSATGTWPNLVPTGAIIESGSNANGEYVKFADGTQIVTFTVFDETVSISNGTTLQLTYTPPVSFTSTIFTTFSGHFTSADGNPQDLIINNGNGLFAVRLTNRSGTTVTRLVPIRCVAIGRWY